MKNGGLWQGPGPIQFVDAKRDVCSVGASVHKWH